MAVNSVWLSMRHFATTEYLEGIYMGQQQYPICNTNITTNGLLENLKSCTIFASTLKRSIQTVEYVVDKYTDITFEVTYLNELIERGLGDFEGKDKHAIRKKYEHFFDEKLIVTKTPPNGESLSDLRKRVDSVVWSISDFAQKRNVLIISHLQTLRMIRYCITKSYDYSAWHSINYAHAEVVKEDYGEK